MKCSQLLEGLVYKCLQGELSSEVTAVVNDSRKLEPGCMFICIKGASFDGHTFAAEAAEKLEQALGSGTGVVTGDRSGATGQASPDALMALLSK